MTALVAFRDVSLQLGQHRLLEKISLEICAGECLGVIGPNGGGKSSLLKLIVGQYRPSSGDIRYLEGAKIPAHFMAYLPQNVEVNHLFPISVEQLLLFEAPQSQKSERDHILEKVGLLHKKKDLFRYLSGGEKQRALLAKILISHPSIVLLDEPTTALDGLGQDQLLTLIKETRGDKKTAVVIVDHNLNEVFRYADRLVCLNKTHHWHDKKELITPDVLESIYHCEFEHLKIHRELGAFHDHHLCHEHGEKK